MEYMIRYLPEQGLITVQTAWSEGDQLRTVDAAFSTLELARSRASVRRFIVEHHLSDHVKMTVPTRVIDAILALAPST